MITRRRFLAATALGALLAASGGTYAVLGERRIVAAALKKIVDLATVPDAVADAFIADEVKYNRLSARRLLAFGAYVETGLDVAGRVGTLFDEYALAVARRFILSTNLYADPARAEYVGYYDPYVRPCANPFARTRADEAAGA